MTAATSGYYAFFAPTKADLQCDFTNSGSGLQCPALIDTLFANLDEQGRARPEAVRRVLDQVRGLAEGVRNARNGG